ncbi:hypothetical protein RSOLAG22IIIB_06086 [Rhizoctonia solani]|uniref:Uncharacterized protein n=1 Tax=Rhizoctonia solani TaxID=456999 RepID=A0A0K6GBF2_9AGAM|nr:hypothetical protein RSOLAG22IIIB_06086 [Rhizoctonia solani]
MHEKDEQLKKFRLQGLEVNRRATRLLGKLNDNKQLLLALSQVDDVAVSRIVKVALGQGCGPTAIVDRLMKAQQSLYRCQSYSKKDIDIALLSLRLGGPRLLEALSKALNLPSLSTVYRHAERLYIRPSVAFPTENEVLANIKAVCGHAQATQPAIQGFSLLIDEIALEERIRYSSAEDLLVGFCRECTAPGRLQNMTGRPVSDIYDLKKLLDSGKCHRAKEATVMAIAPFGPDHYTPMVIVVSGTCKTESVDHQMRLLRLGYSAYKKSPHGAAALGPIWSFETDGDASRRLALFRLCTSRTLSSPSELYLILSPLELVNLECGEDNVTHDGDFKHEEKRFASALRSNTGVTINGTHYSPAFTKQMLRFDVNIPSGRLDALFDNSDRQSVPKAHTLLKGVCNVSQLPEIRKQPGHKPFVLLGELLYAFISPYTVPSMSLLQQVIYLAKCAFILFALFRLDGTRFITGQLYYDIQTTIKTAMFSIAKMQVLAPREPFYLIQLGTDRLENLFGIYRTASHDRNLDILQLAERSSAAQEVDNILAEYPDYDRKPYRLSLKGELGIDHLNPRSWTGDVRVCNVDLQKSWSAGRVEAEEALRRAGITPEFNLKNLRASARGLAVDLMRPFGHYVGVNESGQNASDEFTGNPSSSLVTSTGSSSQPNTGTITNPTLIGPAPVPTAGKAAEPHHFSITDFTDAEYESPLEDVLPPPIMPAGTSEHDMVSTPDGPIKRGWIKVDGRFVHLESATRLILGTESMEKSTDRLRRVRGYSRYPSINESNSILGDVCLIGQLILGLVRVGGTIALAAVRVVSIQIGAKQETVEALSLDQLNTRSDVVFAGQILKLDFSFNDRGWYWDQSYITSPTSVKGKQASTINDKPLLIHFRSGTIELVNPTISEHLGQLTWFFEHDALVASMSLLWSKCSESVHEISEHSGLVDFPYQWETTNGPRLLIHDGASQAVESMPDGKCGICHLCHRMVPINQCMRIHIAKHILAKRLNKEDPLVDDGTIMVVYALCGFCGRSGAPECKITMKVTKKSTSFKSGCPYYDKFSHKSARTSTRNSPCTNRPLLCEYPSHGQAEHNRAINEGLFLVTSDEINFLELDNMFVIPGRNRTVLPAAPIRGTKRPHEDPTNDSSTTLDLSPDSEQQPAYPETHTAVIAPSMLSLLYPLDSNLSDYSREQFLSDLCDECEKDIRQAFAAGAVRVSIDFTEGRLALKNDPRNPWTGRNMLQSFIDLNNRVIDRFTPEERMNIGVHTCPGGDCDSVHSFDVPYGSLLPSLFKMNAGYFLIQCASEADKEGIYRLVGENIRQDANGVKQVAFIGVINPLNPRVETPEEVASDLVTASQYIPVDQLGATDDCGFSPFSIDVKPKHGSPDFAREVAFLKITARVQGAKLASERLGI